MDQEPLVNLTALLETEPEDSGSRRSSTLSFEALLCTGCPANPLLRCRQRVVLGDRSARAVVLQAVNDCRSCAPRLCLPGEEDTIRPRPLVCCGTAVLLVVIEVILNRMPNLGVYSVILPIVALVLAVYLAGHAFCMQAADLLRRQREDRAAEPWIITSSASLEATARLEPATRGRREPEVKMHPLLAERIQQLNERTRICSRRVWEESFLPELRGEEGAEQMRAAMEQCSICMSGIGPDEQVRGLACGHIFHLLCLGEWFIRDRTFELCCPLCRVPLSEQACFTDWEK